MKTSEVMMRALKWSALVALAVALIGGIIGQLVAGAPGAISAFVGAGIALVFLGITTLSIRIGSHFSEAAFFGIVMGAWTLKVLLFLVAIFVLRGQPFINGAVLFWCLVVVTLATLAVDVISMVTGRVPYIDSGSSNDDKPSED